MVTIYSIVTDNINGQTVYTSDDQSSEVADMRSDRLLHHSLFQKVSIYRVVFVFVGDTCAALLQADQHGQPQSLQVLHVVLTPEVPAPLFHQGLLCCFPQVQTPKVPHFHLEFLVVVLERFSSCTWYKWLKTIKVYHSNHFSIFTFNLIVTFPNTLNHFKRPNPGVM